MQRWIFPRWRPRPDLRPRGRSDGGTALRIRWLGTAGHIIETKRTTVLVDPFLSRPGLLRVAARPLVPDEAAIRAHLPERVDAVLLGHSHYDHLLDAPTIARWTGAQIVGSRTTASFARAAGVPSEQITEVPAHGLRLEIGDLSVRFVPSLHGRIFLGRVPLPGEVAEPPRLPARVGTYRMGGAFGLLLHAEGATVYHNGSADLVDAELAGASADVVLVGLAGRQATRDYLQRLVGALGPGLLVPTHHDAFFAPLEEGVRLLPRIDLDGFVAEAGRLAPGARVITPDYLEPLAVPEGDPRGAVLLS